MRSLRTIPILLLAVPILVLSLAAGCGDDDEGNVGVNGDTPSTLDPAPGQNDPGEYRCDTCPDSDATVFERNVGAETSASFQGVVTGAMGDGVFYVKATSPAGKLGVAEEPSEEILGPIETDPETGAYDFTTPLFCGTQIVKCVWSNDEGQYVLVVEVIREDCVEPDIRVTLVWDDLGIDFELHLIREGGRINDSVEDCTWTTCISRSPDWGVQGDPSDNPKKDVDDVTQFGPENIFLSKPETMTYTVMVEHWNLGGDPEADGTVYFNVAGRTIVANIENLAPGWVWTAGTIEWPSGTVRTSTEVFNCTGSWSSGCRADVP